jgi:hypothetical protein
VTVSIGKNGGVIGRGDLGDENGALVNVTGKRPMSSLPSLYQKNTVDVSYHQSATQKMPTPELVAGCQTSLVQDCEK